MKNSVFKSIFGYPILIIGKNFIMKASILLATSTHICTSQDMGLTSSFLHSSYVSSTYKNYIYTCIIVRSRKYERS